MKHPLLVVAFCATGAVAVLSGTAVAAFVAPAASQSTTVQGVAALIVPLGHHPAAFAVPLESQFAADGNILVVAVAGAHTLGSSTAPESASADAPSTARSSAHAVPSPPNPGPAAPAPGQPLAPAPAPAPAVEPGRPAGVSDDEAVSGDKTPKPTTAPKPAKTDASKGGKSGSDDGSSGSSDDGKSVKKDN